MLLFVNKKYFFHSKIYLFLFFAIIKTLLFFQKRHNDKVFCLKVDK